MDKRFLFDLDHSLEAVPCDLCGQSHDEFLYTKIGTLTGRPFRVVRCCSCGLIYLNPRLNERALAGLYDREYYTGKGFDSVINYLADIEKDCDDEKMFRPEQTVKEIKELVPPPSRLLDFGCGLGDFMKQSIKHGYQAEGFEVSPFAAEFVRSNGLKVYTNLEDLPSEQFDMVTAIEVLEHCFSPMKALRAIYRCLKPGGCFYYTTTNFEGFYRRWRSGISDIRDDYIKPEGHIYFFSSSVMKSYFKNIGFSKVFHFEPYAKAGRLFKLLLNFGLINGLADAPAKFLERFLYYGGRSILRTLRRQQPRLPLGRK
jgi:SAM-dependent methyltransferase